MCLPKNVRDILDTMSNLRSLDKRKYVVGMSVVQENGKLVGTIEVREK